jgi:hypothetical protein
VVFACVLFDGKGRMGRVFVVIFCQSEHLFQILNGIGTASDLVLYAAETTGHMRWYSDADGVHAC